MFVISGSAAKEFDAYRAHIHAEDQPVQVERSRPDADHRRVAWEAFGEFLTPVAFAGRLVFADLGHLFAFDGKKRSDLDVRFFESKGRYQGSKEPLALFQVTEGRLLAVDHDGDVMMTTDLETWTCIGKAPEDATSIGSLDGVVYFGSIDASVYGFPAPSW